MKRAYKEVRFRPATQAILNKITEIIEEYQEQGYVLTLRQLYYQLVARDVIPNRVQEYAKLSTILTDARMGGIVDWDAIEDRERVPKHHSEWSNLRSLVNSAIYSFRLPRWEDQPEYTELWTEKRALTSVLEPITDKYHVPLIVNKGYSSTSAMHDAALRLQAKISDGKEVTILYLGDHDPSGLDMDRDIRDRLAAFDLHDEYKIEVIRVGLTHDQIERFRPPPNPAKVTDPRATQYMRKFGRTCWEVDALRPPDLSRIVEKAIVRHLNIEKYHAVIEKEALLKKALEAAAHEIEKGEEE